MLSTSVSRVVSTRWNVSISEMFILNRMYDRTEAKLVCCIKGVWHSVHIDDLTDSEDMSLNLLDFCGTLISNLVNPAPSGRNCAKCQNSKGFCCSVLSKSNITLTL